MDLESWNLWGLTGGLEYPTASDGEIRRQGTLCQPDNHRIDRESSSTWECVCSGKDSVVLGFLMIQKGPKKNLLKTSTVAFSLLCQCRRFLQSPKLLQIWQIWLKQILEILPVLSNGWSSFSTILCNTNEKFAPNTKHQNHQRHPFFVATSGRGGWFSRVFKPSPRLDSVPPELHPEVSDEDVEWRYDISWWLSHPPKMGNFP